MTKTVSLRIYSAIASLTAAAIVLLMSGCATIFSGTTDTISFSTNVDPVRVYIGGRFVGTTPLTTTVHRAIGEGPQVKFEKEGYGTQAFSLEKEFNWVSVLDVSSLLTSGGIDVLSGAIMKYSKDRYHVEMIPGSARLEDGQRQIAFAKFVLLNADNIRADLARDGGEYLETLSAWRMTDNTSPGIFKFWLTFHKDELISSYNPEALLATLRQSELTP